MQPIHQSVVAIQAKMFANRLTPITVLRRAGVSTSTWTRWRRGMKPRTGTLDLLDDAITQLVAERDPQEEPANAAA